jgi:hypothetical protein
MRKDEAAFHLWEPAAVNTSKVITVLGRPDGAVTIPIAARKIDCQPGLYSIFINDPTTLPEPFRSRLIVKRTQLLYVGMASGSLYERLIEQELRHKKAATFFRGMGAAQSYRPVRGSLRDKANKRNYRFSPADSKQIIAGWSKNSRYVGSS